MKRALFLLILILVAPVALAETGVADSNIFTLNTAFVTGVQEGGQIPAASGLNNCYPNPFNPQTTVEFSLAKNGQVDLAVYDLKGRLVAHLIKGESMTQGVHDATWRGRNQSGAEVAGGVYVFRLKIGQAVFNQRVTLIK
jgi:hypothetical protein